MSQRTTRSDPMTGELPAAPPRKVALQTPGIAEATRDDWVRAAAAVLRKSGKLTADTADSTDTVSDQRVCELLTSRTIEDLAIPPLGTAAAANAVPVTRRSTDTTQGWDIRSLIADPDRESARATLVSELNGGATSILLTVEPAGAGGTTAADLADVLEPVLLGVAAVVLDAPAGAPQALQAFAALVRDKAVAPARGTSFGIDPLSTGLRGEASPDLSGIAEIATTAGDLGIGAFVIDGTAAHNLGAGEAQEIGWTLAAGVCYLRQLESAGIELDRAALLIDFRYAVTDNQFLSIAKLRAARQLWARVLQVSGAADTSQRQHAVTSRPMMSRYDPWVNMLRTTVAAFAAGAGGAQSVTVLPFDSALGIPDSFGRRIARNVSHLLIGESHVAAVADPAGGAFAVEQLTDQLATAAWAEFGRIENSGGATAALADGSVRERIAESRAQLRARLGARSSPLTGVSKFPNLAEQLPRRQPTARYTGFSWPADFEALRDSPSATPVFLATLGSAAAHSTRAGFVVNALAAGGIPSVGAGATQTVADLVAAYDPAVTTVVCLVGTDADYVARGAEAIAALRDAGARKVLIAGKPATETEPLIDAVIAVGTDVPGLCRRVRGYLGETHPDARSAELEHS